VSLDSPRLRQVSQEMSEVHGKTNLGLALAKQKADRKTGPFR
jgi:hypothetical protein